MIQDATELAKVRQNWVGLEALRTQLKVSGFASVSGNVFPFALSNAANNLPFFHAYGILNDVLRQLAIEGHFNKKYKSLGDLLRESKTALTWRDFALVESGKDRRNKVAHKGILLDRGDCWKYIDAVKVELCGWGVIQ